MIIHSYPKEVKPFYVRLNDDKKTVAAFDLVVPKVRREKQTKLFDLKVVRKFEVESSTFFFAGWRCDQWEPKRRTV